MSWYGGYDDFAPYVPVATRIARGHAAAKKLAAKEGRSPDPVKIDGRKIAKTFWGLKWCENLERYRDYANRLPRGATYVRNGSVADLVIKPGSVRAIVGGSEAYTVDIKVKTLSPAAWQSIGRDCAHEIESLFDLLQGRISDGVMARLTRAEDGLFPRPAEITMTCTCPDGAFVCKHIAAVMYGIGSRLDLRPELLFTLRQVDHRELIRQAASTANLDQSLAAADGLALSDGELMDLFGIEMGATTRKPRAGKKPSQSTVQQKSATKTRTKAAAKIVIGKTDDTISKIAVPLAVKKRAATRKTTVVESGKPLGRKSKSATKADAPLKAKPKESVRLAKDKLPVTTSAPRKSGTTAAKPSARRQRASPSPTANKPARTQRSR